MMNAVGNKIAKKMAFSNYFQFLSNFKPVSSKLCSRIFTKDHCKLLIIPLQ